MKTIGLALLGCVGFLSACFAADLRFSSASGLVIPVDWQDPSLLPPRFRNHCSIDINTTDRRYCSNHCGLDYQLYYCSQISFGCCHVGRGYCDWDNHLRCTP